MDQPTLNAEVQALGLGRQDWASYVGVPIAKVRGSQSRRANGNDIAAIIGTLETDLDKLQGPFMRKQTVALMLSRGAVWTLNCGATDFDPVKVRARSVRRTLTNAVQGHWVFCVHCRRRAAHTRAGAIAKPNADQAN